MSFEFIVSEVVGLMIVLWFDIGVVGLIDLGVCIFVCLL